MVNIIDQTIVATVKLTPQPQPSFKRWLKHFCYVSSSKRYFKQQDEQAIATAVQHAEQGHAGEIQVVIEGHIPCAVAYQQNTQQRAQHLFASLGVWDTAANSGVLLYLNLCERQVEIVVDRGIHALVMPEVWQQICDNMIICLKQAEYRQAVLIGVEQIGQQLQQFYLQQQKNDDDELPNSPVLL
ncbi:TPM domain-containing protein [Acinetobacter sp. MD2(2019)]|uniref:TPM domain-containing protein n=1 Tax=Acinetobacter sp. MD2(2019) TaxID=2605273 RepID=UPI002D1E8CF6|nr:TPM domain-containing protein [Acinetobacter sp. MD2(2019)]MEB3753217.1 TPM domain-containing protein [Acinetobacter sp. MD2(2019)]